MANLQQIQAALRHVASNQAAAQTYLQNPVAAYQAMGLSLPPGVTAAQLSQHLTQAPIHKAIVSTSQGQMSAQDWSTCSQCMAVAGYLLAAAGGVAALLAAGPESLGVAWIAGIFGVSTVQLAGILAAGGSAVAFALCGLVNQCP
jgi:hypothetical protein